jgi:virginiamycin B lyase
VIVAPNGAAWVTDAGLNAIVRVDPRTLRVRTYPLPKDRPDVHLNTATVGGDGFIWFTGQRGIYGRVNPKTGRVRVWDAPGGAGPYGITTTPDGEVYYASLDGSHIAHVDIKTGRATRIYPPTEGQGARRVWSDSRGRIWVSEWNSGKVGMYDPAADDWEEWELPGHAQPYAVFVDNRDIVWLSDFASNAIVRFDPRTERFTKIDLPSSPGEVRQILGRRGEVWGAESAADALVVVRTR